MARPTDEKKDKTVKLRISEDLYDELVKKGPNLSETIRKILKNKDYSVPQNEKSKKSLSATPLNEEIEEMLSVSGLSVEKFLDDLTEMMNDGSFDLSGGKLSIVYPSYVSDFEEACHDCCVSVEEAMKKATKALRKGSI